MKTTLVILTYDEIEGVKKLLPTVPSSKVDESFAVDGGSTDGTIEYFKRRGIRVITQDKKGRGEALRIAVREAKNDALIFFSPDGNENPNDIPQFRHYLENGYDMVIASRMMKGGVNEEDIKIIRIRKWANQVFTFIANILFGKGDYITDTINGYRAVTKEAFKKLKPDAEGFAVEYQMSIRAMKLNLKIKEFPTIEGQRISSKTNAPSIITGLRFLFWLSKEIRIGKNF